MACCCGTPNLLIVGDAAGLTAELTEGGEFNGRESAKNIKRDITRKMKKEIFWRDGGARTYGAHLGKRRLLLKTDSKRAQRRSARGCEALCRGGGCGSVEEERVRLLLFLVRGGGGECWEGAWKLLCMCL